MSNVADKHAERLAKMSMADIEREVLALRAKNPIELSDEDLEWAVSLHATARRLSATSGPAKPKSNGGPGKSLDELAALL